MRRIDNRLFHTNYKTMQLTVKAGAAVFALFVLSANCFADPFKPAVIDDADGFTNIRAEKSANSALIGKVKTGEVFYAEPAADSWWRVAAIEGKTGFISKTHIRLIEESPGSDAARTRITPADILVSENPTDAEAQYTMGLKYFYGFGIPTDRKVSRVWFLQAAGEGHLAAKASLGRQIFLGEGGQKDRELGMSLIKPGLEAGNARAQSMFAICLATLYDESDGFSARNKRLTVACISWLRKAAAQGGVDGVRAAGAANEIEQAYRADIRNEAAAKIWNTLIGAGSGGSEQCPRCFGTGRDQGFGTLSCQYCDGTGVR
jgi:TPR repeat protein